MPNATEIRGKALEKILLVGDAGGGKSTQILTLPGKKFAYAFDPNAPAAYAGYDIDFEQFSPEVTDLDISVKTLKTGIGDKPIDSTGKARRVEPKTYINFEKDFYERYQDKFFDKYDIVVLDSLTTFSEIIMDRTLYLNNRLGKQPEQADWSAQMTTINNVLRMLVNCNVNVLCTGHLEMREDQVTHRIYRQMLVTGKLRIRLPLMFSNIFGCICSSDKDEIKYVVQTRPDKDFPMVRVNIQGLQFYEDVTIKDFKNPANFGLGALLKKAGKLPVKSSIVPLTTGRL